MMKTHQYGCFCPGCTGGQITAIDQRNTSRGGSTRSLWKASPTVTRAVVLPPICEALKAAKLRHDAEQAEREAIEAADTFDTSPTMPALIRERVRSMLRLNRPDLLPEIRRAVSEWWHGEVKTHRDALETMAAGLLMTAVAAAGVAMLMRWAVLG